MKTFSILTGVLLVALLCSLPAVAADHESLNGSWALATDQSNFAGQTPMQAGTITISQENGTVRVARSFRYGDAGEEVFYRDITESPNNTPVREGELKSETSWNNDVLKVDTVRDGRNVVETYSLAPNGNLIVTVTRGNEKPSTLVFTRK